MIGKAITRTLRLLPLLLICLALFGGSSRAQTHYLLGQDSQPQPGVPQGKTFQFELAAGPKYYPGTKSTVTVYVPAQYTPNKPACLCVGLDGPNYRPQTVFDNLIFRNQMPVTIGVFLSSGTVIRPGTTNEPLRFDRCYEFDSTNDTFARFLTEEVLPAVERHAAPDGRVLRLSSDPNDRMIYGGSSGGVCAWTAAWQRPDLFRRVFTAIGTYVGMRGADMYPTLIRKTEPKPLRVFLQDGARDTWNPLFDNWYTQNRSMEESLSFAGYDVSHSWGTLGHEGSHAESLFPDVMKWLWRDYPAPIVAGKSGNSMLRSVLVAGADWHAGEGVSAPGHLTVSTTGDVYYTDAGAKTITRIGADGVPVVFARSAVPITAVSAGVGGRLFAALADGRIVSFSANGKLSAFSSGVRAGALFAAEGGSVYASEPGAHDDMPSRLWRLGPGGSKALLDTGLRRATGLVLTPDHALLFAAEGGTHWVYSYVLMPDGRLTDKQRFYWLHTAEGAGDEGDGSGATDMAVDTQGDLFVATRMGVQVCDRNGRVEGILTLPPGRVTSLCFGGRELDTLFVVCGGRLYARKLAVRGVAPASAPAALPPFGGG